MNKSVDILGTKVSAIDLCDAREVIDGMIQRKGKGYVCVCPVSTIVECDRDAQYRQVVNDAALVTPDGMPTVWIGRLKGYKNISRVYGPDLMLSMCELSSQKRYKNFFYGATDEVLKKLEKKLKEKFPGLEVAGRYSPPFRKLSLEEDMEITEKINLARPDILWVGLGAPKQDFWMHAHRDKLEVSVMLGVGAAFDFLSGYKKQAPLWMRKIGLEWFFRLCCEPRRLAKRYIVGNARFVYLLIHEAVSGIIHPKKDD